MERTAQPTTDNPHITGVDFEILTDHPQLDEHLRVFRAPEGKVFRMEGSFTVLLNASDTIMPYPASSRRKFLSTQSGRDEFEELRSEQADYLWQKIYDEWVWLNRYNKDFEWSRFEEWVEMNISDHHAFQAYLHRHINDDSYEQFRFEQVVAENAYSEQAIWDELQRRLELAGMYEHFPDSFEGEWLHIEYEYDGMVVAIYEQKRPYAKFFSYWEESRRVSGAVDWIEMTDFVIKEGYNIATFQPDREDGYVTLVDRKTSNVQSKTPTQDGISETITGIKDGRLKSLSSIALNYANEKDTP